MTWHTIYALVGLTAVVVGLVSTLIFRKISWKIGFLDVPMREGHKLHDQATPLLGGVAMTVSWLIVTWAGVIVPFVFNGRLPVDLGIEGIRHRLPLLWMISGGGLALCILGLVDDKRPLGWKIKLTLQAIICGIVVSDPKVRLSMFVDVPWLTWLISLCVFLFIINAFNFFDNMDGLASGVAVIASLLFALVSAYRGNHFVTVLGLTTAGVSLGYYVFNRYPASIFMGDSGSHFLGYMLAIQSALTTFWTQGTPTIAPLLIPCFVLALPIFDTFAVIVIRLRNGKPIFVGDHNHISHRFLRMGVSKKTAVLLVHLLTLALGLGAVTLLFLGPGGVILILLQNIAILTLISILHVKSEDTSNDTRKDS